MEMTTMDDTSVPKTSKNASNPLSITMHRYLVVFAHTHLDFRVAELIALAQLHGIEMHISNTQNHLDSSSSSRRSSPFLEIELKSDEDAALLASRAVLIRRIVRLCAQAPSINQLATILDGALATPSQPITTITDDKECMLDTGRVERYDEACNELAKQLNIVNTFRYLVLPFGLNLTKRSRINIINSLIGLGVPQRCRARLSGADVDICIFCDFGDPNDPNQNGLSSAAAKRSIKRRDGIDKSNKSNNVASSTEVQQQQQQQNADNEENGQYGDGDMNDVLQVYLGYHVGEGGRSVASQIGLKTRAYLGTTTMDAELSLIMANMALVDDTSLVLDPFVGTGSILIACAKMGGHTMGTDIDGRQIRGTGKATSFASNVAQYGLTSKVEGTVVADFAHRPWRNTKQPLWDAIVTDPPYGVRAGAKKIGLGSNVDIEHHSTTMYRGDGELRYPQTIPYAMEEVVSDLITYAAAQLRVGGRLVFWLPTVRGEHNNQDLPKHPALELVAESEQPFGRWSRVLVTYEKKRDVSLEGIESECIGEEKDERTQAPAHASARFLRAYYNRDTLDSSSVGQQ